MPTVRHGYHIDLMFNELRQARIQAVDGLPASSPGNAGWLVYNLPDKRLYYSTGTGWSSSASAAAFEHVQTVPQAVITVTHGLGYRPSVTAFALDFSQQFAEFQTQHLDANSLRVSMDSPQACVLVMS